MGMDEAARHTDHQMQLQGTGPHQRNIARRAARHRHQSRRPQPAFGPPGIATAQTIGAGRIPPQRQRDQPDAIQAALAAPMQAERHADQRPRPLDHAHAPG